MTGNRTDRGTFKKGQSGNPKGAPKKEHALTHALEEMVDNDKLARELRYLAFNRKVDDRTRLTAIIYIYDRCEGRPPQSLGLSQEGEDWLVTVKGAE